jgi:hypothetical protein
LQALHDGSPIYQVHADVSPLFWVSNDGDVITRPQFYDLSNVITGFNLDPTIFIGRYLGVTCNHSFDNWPAEETEVINWLHLRLNGGTRPE